MDELLEQLAPQLEGTIHRDVRTLERYSTDASLYTITPSAVIIPKNTRDIRTIVRFVNEHKALYPDLSITVRGAGTDMSGGPLNDSLILDVTQHFSKILALQSDILTIEPGAYMRDVDRYLAKTGRTIGAVPASRSLCTIGGMVANNSGGELSLRYGNIAKSVVELKVILADGKEYTITPLSRNELQRLLDSTSFLAGVYRELLGLIHHHDHTIQQLRPHVHKNSTGYNLWDVYDPTTQQFDVTQLFCGSQGTLGIITRIKIKTVPAPQHTGMLLAYSSQPNQLGDIIKIVHQHHPLTFEGFDDITFRLGIRYFSEFKQQLGLPTWLREQAALARQARPFGRRLPPLVLMVEFDGNDNRDTAAKLLRLQQALSRRHIKTTIVDDDTAASFWRVRRASLALLRAKVHDHYAAPFIDDITVEPRFVPEFLPKLQKIIRASKLPATIAGHFGDGNFHIIPLVDLSKQRQTAKLEPMLRKIIPLVQRYGGSLAGEHNDGLVRGPWLRAMYGEAGFELFQNVKALFDPMNIFNPHKKTDARWQVSMGFLRQTNDDEGLIVLKNT